MMPTL